MPSAVLADESSPSAPSVLQRLLMWAGLLIFTAVFILVVHSQREAPRAGHAGLLVRGPDPARPEPDD